MSKQLDDARAYLAAATYGKAVGSLWAVYNHHARSDSNEARGLLEIASTISTTTGIPSRFRREAGILAGYAQGFLQRLDPEPQVASGASTSGEHPASAISGQPPTVVASAVTSFPAASFSFSKLLSVIAALTSIGAGIYLLSAHSVVNLGNGTISWFQIIAHGMGIYFIAKGLYMGASLYEQAEQNDLLRSRR